MLPVLLMVCSLTTSAAPAATLELRDGDRVVLIGSTLIEREQNDGYLETVLVSRFPGRSLVFRNLAWSGDTVEVQTRPLNFGTLEEHVDAIRPDWIIAGFGSNELFEGAAGVEHFVAGYQRLLDRLTPSGARLVLITPPQREDPGLPLPDLSQQNQTLGVYAAAIGRLAAGRNAKFVDLLTADFRDAHGRPIDWTDNGLHLTPAGYRLFALQCELQLGWPARPWNVVVDAARGTVTAEGTQAHDVAATSEGVRIKLHDALLPVPPVPHGAAYEMPQAAPRRLVVRGLHPGTYELTIDNQPLRRADAEAWSAGVLVDAGPEWSQVEKLRQAIVDKNFWFFHRWRAHNGEYIYGRRAAIKSPGDGQGNAGNPQFPREFAELDRLVAQREAEIDRLAVPVEHTYELKPTTPQ